ncbi:hypothetical protein [Sporisorium scitamineum]|uniref:Uncharacterized protein n=1 Tax=Sporisorium scitamineum TaxID=49012 RepID=A0A0F7S9Y8_9BASI|nr:hypothetical protein [Sporisorium scitamineum]
MEEEKTKREEMRFALKREEGERRERMREKEQEWLLQLIRLSRQGQRGSQDGSQNGFNLGPLLSLDMVRYSDKQELLSDLEVAISATLIVETLLQQEFAADTDSNDESDDEMDDIDLRLGEYPNYSDNL